MDKIILLLLSEIDEDLVGVLEQGLGQTFNRLAEVRYKIGNLEYAFAPSRKQYISPRILSRLQRIKKRPRDKILAVVDVDLYSPEYDFVYGEADVNSGVATLSIYRLIPKGQNIHSDVKLFEERIIGEATHEVGHLYGLGHCRNPKCVMRSCTCLPEVDEAGNDLCAACRKNLEKMKLPEHLQK